MVHVSNRPHVHVRLGTLKLAFCHFGSPEKRAVPVIGLRSPEPQGLVHHRQWTLLFRRPT